MKLRSILTACVIASLLLFTVVPSRVVAANSCDDTTLCDIDRALELPTMLAGMPSPTIVIPAWMKPKTTFTYSVETRGSISADINEFKQRANATLNDARGWSRLDAAFTEVSSGGAFTLVLSESSQVPSFSSTGCSTTYSCNVGRYVIINQDRWLGATPAWNNGGGSLRDYRHMVINHETGHWLGHSHEYCSGPGQPAPVMQQQSIDLQGCTFNPWPLASEIWSSRL
jgi:Protein of unknown function (DUF3152)